MMTETSFSHRCNHVLTTNFDDLVADACYLFTDKKPLTINDSALIPYLEQNTSRPIILKLHGDAKTTPLHLTEELSGQLHEEYKKALQKLMERKGIIFLGYGGNDQTIMDLLKGTRPHFPIYWVNRTFPDNDLGQWMRDHGVFWVEHRDFDELMLHLHQNLELKHPKWDRFTTLQETYHAHFNQQAEETSRSPNAETQKMAQKAKDDSEAWAIVQNLLKFHTDEHRKEPIKAMMEYDQAVEKYPDFSPLISNYALFLYEANQLDKAKGIFKKALELNSKDTKILGNYALYLEKVGDTKKAENFFQNAISADPTNAHVLRNYAYFLKQEGRKEQAEEYYLKAIRIAPNNANYLGNYALFLKQEGRMEQAEEYYLKTIEAAPHDADYLGNFALFLNQENRKEQAEEYFVRAIEANPNNTSCLANFAFFLRQEGRKKQAEEYYLLTIETDPENADSLGSFAIFLKQEGRKKQAEEYYCKAITADPKHANSLGNLAQIFFEEGRDQEAIKKLEEASECAIDQALILELYFYRFAHLYHTEEGKAAYHEITKLLDEGVRSLDFDLSGNVARAEKDKHPEIDKVRELAKEIGTPVGEDEK
ncbi:tetratricopeptide repeat protein [Terasakiella sp. SH-1]|uniref:tetratricopeptide repeat protein n=1 Tax=Terasakiella sp. SH-1 TaxID=2560057 RepID=UPI001430A961|nr:tetratricopeptide repeat protein [Terasakiella sp. SH-1]